MKRIFTIILTSLVSLTCLAQAQVTIVSRKEKLADFPTKTMKVVLPGEDYVSMALREALRNAWSVSAYEFCGPAEFNALKEKDGYYFMVPYKNEGKKYDGITYLTVVKSGAKELGDMMELATMPLAPGDEPLGREGAYMPAILDVMQRHIERSLVEGSKNISSMVEKAPKAITMDLVIDECDLGSGISEKLRAKKLQGVVKSSAEAAAIFQDAAARTEVGYTISPTEPGTGAVCYKMLFDARTHSLYYFEKHKISESNGRGFLKKDISKLTAGRK